jgi:hypothetical protein
VFLAEHGSKPTESCRSLLVSLIVLPISFLLRRTGLTFLYYLFVALVLVAFSKDPEILFVLPFSSEIIRDIPFTAMGNSDASLKGKAI